MEGIKGNRWARTPRLRILLMMPLLLLAAADPAEDARKDIVAAYQRSLDALQRGDADAAMQINTNDWISVTVAQKPRTARRWSLSSGRTSPALNPRLGGPLTGKNFHRMETPDA